MERKPIGKEPEQNVFVIPKEAAASVIERAVQCGWLLCIRTHSWGNRKMLSRELLVEKFQDNARKISAVKHLVDTDEWGKATYPLRKVVGEVRKLALDWLHPNSGIYFVPEVRMAAVQERLDKFGGLLTAAREEFRAAYPGLIERAKAEAPELFDPKDYPTADEICWGLRFEYFWQKLTLPGQGAGESKVVSKEVVERENARFREMMKAQAEETISATRTAFLGVITHLRDCLADKGKKFQDSTVQKPLEFLKAFGEVNLYGDKPFAEFAKKAAGILEGVEGQDLRDDAEYRAAMAGVMTDVVRSFTSLPTVRLQRDVEF